MTFQQVAASSLTERMTLESIEPGVIHNRYFGAKIKVAGLVFPERITGEIIASGVVPNLANERHVPGKVVVKLFSGRIT